MSKRFLNTITLGLVAGLAAQFPANSKIVVAGEGSWAYSLPNYDLEFTPASGFTGTPTPLTATEIASLRVPSTQYIMVEPTAVGEPSRFKVAVTTDFKPDGTIGVGFLAAGLTEAQITPLVDAAIQAALQNANYADIDDVETGLNAVNMRIDHTNGNLQLLSGLVEVLRQNQHATRFIKANALDPAETSYFLDVACTTAPDATAEANLFNFKLYATENGEYDVNGATVTLAKGDIVVVSSSGSEILRQDTSRITTAETAISALQTQMSALQTLANKGTNGSIVSVGEAQTKLDAIVTAAVKGVYAIAVRTNGDEEQTEVITSPSTATANWDANYTVRAGSQIELEIDENGVVIAFFVDNDSATFALIVSLTDTITALSETVNQLSIRLTEEEDAFTNFRALMDFQLKMHRENIVTLTQRAHHYVWQPQFAGDKTAVQVAQDVLGGLMGSQDAGHNLPNMFDFSITVKGAPLAITCEGTTSYNCKADDILKISVEKVNGNWTCTASTFYPNQSATIAQVEALAAIIDPNLFG